MSFVKSLASIVPSLLVGAALVSVSLGDETVRPSIFGFSLTVGVKHVDNRDNVPEDYFVKDEKVGKEGNTQLVISPSISFNRFVEGRYRIQLSYSPSYIYYDNPRQGSTKKEWEHSARALVEMALTGQAVITMSDNYWWSGAKDWEYGPDYEFAPGEREDRNDDYYKNTFSLAIKYDLTSDDYLHASGFWSIKRYEDDYLALYHDEDLYVFLVELVRREGRHLSYGVYAEYTAFDRSNGEKAEPMEGEATPGHIDVGVQYVNIGLRASYDFFGNKDLVLSGRTGYNRLWYEAEDIEDDDMLGDTVIELLLFQQQRTSSRFGLKFGKEYSNVYPYSSQDNITLFASATRILGRSNKARINADLEYRTRTYELAKIDPDADEYGYYKQRLERIGDKGDAKRDTIYLRLSASYRWSESFSTSAFYSYENVDSEITTSYTVNTFGVNATYRFQ